MATTYRTPGVYIEEISKFPPSIAEVETAIPAFIGYTQKAAKGGVDYLDLLKKSAAAAETAKKAQEDADKAKTEAEANPSDTAKQDAAKKAQEDADKAKADADVAKFTPVPVRITSLLEYEKFFGQTQNEKGITVAVTSEDVTAKIAQVPAHNMYYSLQAYFANGGGPCYIVPVGGLDATITQAALKTGLDAIAKEDEVTLIVFPESLSLIDVKKLSGDENSQNAAYGEYKALYDAALQQCNALQDRFVVMEALLDPATLDASIKNFSVVEAANAFRNSGIGINNLKYGAAYAPQLETIFNYLYADSDVNVTIYKDSKGQVTVPNDPDVQTPTPVTLESLNPKNKPAQDGQFYPFVQSAIDRMPVIVPSAPLVVGVYASVDNDRGVWKAPANVSLGSVIQPTVKITKTEQEDLNVHTTGKSINAIRAFTGKGTLVWGARTLAGNDNEWRYIPVRRFFNMAEESIKKATEQFVFEPNDANTWTKVRAMIENFLILQWRSGALQGAKPEQSFYVKVGLNETMTALDILEGRLIVEIGMAVVRPAEFIILKFSHKMVES